VYPVYAHVIRELYRDYAERPFKLITIVTDSITVNSTWFRAPSDLMRGERTDGGGPERRAGAGDADPRAGFPVSHFFSEPPATALNPPTFGEPRRILYLVNTGRKRPAR